MGVRFPAAKPVAGAQAALSEAVIAPGRQTLRHLLHLRNLGIAVAVVLALLASEIYGVALPLTQLLAALGSLALFNLYTWYRLGLPRAATEDECFRHLVVDLAVLSYLLYSSGGDTNPFWGLFLVPLTISAAYLSWKYTLAVTAITVGSYTLLHFQHLPLEMRGGAPVPVGLIEAAIDVTYLSTSGFIAFFVARIAATAREQAAALASAREKQLNDRVIVGFGSLAAGAAHELATPLSVIAVLVKELKTGHTDAPEALEVIGKQVEACKQTLRCLAETAGRGHEEQDGEGSLDRYLDSITRRFQVLRPDARPVSLWNLPAPAPLVRRDAGLAQAVVTLLNNAADASRDAVEMAARVEDEVFTLEVSDRGPGIPGEIAERLGQPFVTTKGPARGMGMGLFLAKTSIERLGGALEFQPREGGGTRARITLPLTVLRA